MHCHRNSCHRNSTVTETPKLLTKYGDDLALRRMEKAGAVITTMDQIISELVIDWTSPNGQKLVRFSDINNNHENSGQPPVVESDLKGALGSDPSFSFTRKDSNFFPVQGCRVCDAENMLISLGAACAALA